MSSEEVFAEIKNLVLEIQKENDLEQIEVTNQTRLLGVDLGIDSLDLAVMITKLEEKTGKKPFEKGFVNFQTVEELVSLFS